MRRQESGFTLIELVIVLVILGILAAVAVPQFVNTTATAQNAAASGGKQSAASCIATYTARNKTAPTVTQLVTECSTKNCSSGFLQISSTSPEGVKVTMAKLTGGTAATTCASVVVGVISAKYTTAGI